MISPRSLAFLFLCLCQQVLVWGADPPPQFTPEGVVRGEARVRILVPGAGMSIYGRYLGFSASDCAPSCDTQVFVGDKPAELLYVSEKQINFKVPLDAPPSDGAELRVVYRGQSSVPLIMQVGPEKTTVSLDQPAYAGMPVWLRVELPFENGTIRYPYLLGPAGFGCNEVEVRRNGESLPLVPGSSWMRSPMRFSGNICGSYALESPPHSIGRLPLHLLYNFRAPGTYEVRFTLRSMPFGALSQTGFKVRSEWTPFEVLPSQPNRRAEWLKSLRDHPPVEPGELLTDTLPGLLGIPDESSLEILTGYLYHSDSSVRKYAMNGLSYWPEESVSRKLLALLLTKGPSDVIVRFLARQPGFGAPHTPEIDATSLPALGAMLVEREQQNSDERDFRAILPEILYRHFGDAAVPYLERALSTAGETLTARNIALQLMIANDPVGFQFAARVVEQKRDSAIDMIQVLKRQFPELKDADANAVAAFVGRHAGQERK